MTMRYGRTASRGHCGWRPGDKLVQVFPFEPGQFVIGDTESYSPPFEAPVPERSKPIPGRTSRRRRSGDLRHAVMDEVVDHETSALIRPFWETAMRQLGQLKSREFPSREVSPEFVGVVRVIRLEGRRAVRRGQGDGFVDGDIHVVDFLPEFCEFPHQRIATQDFDFCYTRLSLSPDDRFGMHWDIKVILPS